MWGSNTNWISAIETGAIIPEKAYDKSDRIEKEKSKKKRNSGKGNLRTSASKLEGLLHQLALNDDSVFTRFSAEPTYIPNDSSLFLQWHLKNTTTNIDINVEDVWNDYTGAGVKIAILDDGVEYTHKDLVANYDTTLDLDVSGTTTNNDDAMAETGDRHGTSVAGIIAADDNGVGGVGVAYDSTIAGIRLDINYLTIRDLVNSFNHAANFDVMNNSWSMSSSYYDKLDGGLFLPVGVALQNTVETGRDGLGTSIVFSAGNSKQTGDNVNNHGLQNSRYTITVGGITHNGTSAFYSTPGAAVLVSAPSDSIYTTDRTGTEGYAAEDYTASFGGTSAAAPMVTGIIALMYEANPLLGYRDVQEILALSARQTKASNPEWTENGAGNWNGGGMHVSHDVGFGLVDAYTAVRLAESWTMQNTAHNEEIASVSGTAQSLAAGAISTITLSVGIHLDIDQIELNTIMSGVIYFLNTLTISLTSPDGTTSILAQNANTDLNGLDWGFTSTHHWGEDAYGDWTVTFENTGTSAIDLSAIDLNLYGDATDDDIYVYTKEFSDFANAERTILGDTDGGNDTINAAAVLSNSTIDLNAGAVSTIDGRYVLLSAGTVIENITSGDGDDTLIGNELSNTLSGGRGDDTLIGNAGDDVLMGGSGNDTALFSGLHTDYTISENSDGTYLVTGNNGSDILRDIEWLQFDDEVYDIKLPWGINQAPIGTTTEISANEDLTVSGILEAVDPEGNSYTFSLVAVPESGELTINSDGSFEYNPLNAFESLAEGDSQTLTFTYRVTDEFGAFRDVEAHIVIAGQNDAPIIEIVPFNQDVSADNTTMLFDENYVKHSEIAELSNGNVVIVSSGNLPQENADDVKFKIIDSDGNTVKELSLLSETLAGSQRNARVVVFPDGRWMAIWQDANQSAFYARTFSDDGTPLTGEFWLTDTDYLDPSVIKYVDPEITLLSDNKIALSWRSNSDAAHMQIFDDLGTALTSDTALTNTGFRTSLSSEVVELANGNLLISTSGYDDTVDNNGYKSFLQIYNPNLEPTFAAREIFAQNGIGISDLQLTKLANGNILASWLEYMDLSLRSHSYIQVLDSYGNPISPAQQYDGGYILAHPDNGFTTYFNQLQGDDILFRLQRYDDQGQATGTPEVLNLGPRSDTSSISDALITKDGTLITISDHLNLNLTITKEYISTKLTFNISDIDSTQLHSAEIVITGAYEVGEDTLTVALSNATSISQNFVSETGTLYLTGIASIEEYKAAIQSIRVRSLIDGVRTISVRVNDGAGSAANSNWKSIDIHTVPAENTAPQTQTDNLDVAEDFAINGVLSAIDLDGDALSFALTDAPTKGTLLINDDGSYSYNPQGAFESLADGETEILTFSYSVSDGIATVTQTVTITVTGANDAPIVSVNDFTALEDSSVSGTLSATDIDGDTLTFSLVEAPAKGFLSINADGTFVFDPFKSFEALDIGETETLEFTYSVSDGINTISKTAAITVLGNNDAPVITLQNSDAEITSESTLNAYTSGNQRNGKIIQLNDGRMLATWTGASETRASSVMGQLLNADGTPIGGNIQFNAGAGFDQSNLTVTALSDGGFLAVWGEDVLIYTSKIQNVVARRYDANGQPVAEQFTINQFQLSASMQVAPDIAELADGRFIVTWESAGNPDDTSGDGVSARFLDQFGGVISEEFTLNSSTYNSQSMAQVVGLDNGGFAAVWHTTDSSSVSPIKLRYFDSDGNATTPELDVTQNPTSQQMPYELTKLSNGNLIISWYGQNVPGDTSLYGVAARIYSADGQPVGDEFSLATSTEGNQFGSALTATSDGGFIAFWSSANNNIGTYGRRFDETGQPVSVEFKLNDTPYNYPTMVELDDGRFMVLSSTYTNNQYDVSLGYLTFPTDGNKQVSISDVDDATLSSAIIQITDGYVAGSDILKVTLPDGSAISALFDPATGTLTLSGNATLAEYQAAIQSLDIQSSIEGSRTVSIQVDDGSASNALSNIIEKTIATSELINNIPVAETTDVTANEDSLATGTLMASDADGNALTFALIGTPTKGTLTLYPDGSYSFDPQGAFEALDEGETETLEFTYTVSDGIDTISKTAAITVLGNNEAPVITLQNGGAKIASESTLNAYTSGNQRNGKIIQLNDGRMLATWTGASETSASSVMGQLLNADGTPIGGNIQFNADASFDQSNLKVTRNLTVTALADGGFLAVWGEDVLSYTWPIRNVVARRYDANGQPVAEQFTINQFRLSASMQIAPDIAELVDGRFIVTWESAGNPDDTSGNGVSARFLDQFGGVISEEFTLNSSTYNSQSMAEVVGLDNGGFAAVWHTTDSSSVSPIKLQYFDSDGNATTPELDVTQNPTSQQMPYELTKLSNGNLIISWYGQNVPGDTSLYGVAARIYSADGQPVGDEFSLATSTEGNQFGSTLTATSDGGFIAFWSSANNSIGTYGRRFDETGQPVSVEFKLNDTPYNYPTMVELDDGRFMVLSSTYTNNQYDVSLGYLTFPTDGNKQVSISDVDDATLSSAIIQITDGYVAGSDILKVTLPDGSAISALFDPATGTLTLSGNATLAEYQAAIQSLDIQSSIEGSRTVSIQVDDGSASNALSNIIEKTITPPELINSIPIIETTDITANKDSLAIGIDVIDINVEDVWNDYTGAGVKVAILDDGIEYTHEDLATNYDTSFDLDVSANDDDAMAESGDRHGTAVAGLIAADNNDLGGVGVAYDSTIAGIKMSFGIIDTTALANAFAHAQNFDVMNNSWSVNVPFADSLYYPNFYSVGQSIENTVANGRDGLGTSIVFSAGNTKARGDNINYHGFQNSRYTIAVGAIGNDGKAAYYSTPGASILVSAPSSDANTGIFTTDRTGDEGYSSGDYTSKFGGTSAAAAIVSGIIALMYEANPLLGYRDVQEILALAARQTDATNPEWAENGATNWNGGGMHFSHEVGFGLVDTYTAVRLAETWMMQHTAHNEVRKMVGADGFSLAGGTTTTLTLSSAYHLDIDQVNVSLHLSGEDYFLSSLRVTLTSPSGTTSVLLDNPNANYTSIEWDFTSTQHWGEDSFGDWTLTFENSGSTSIDFQNTWLDFYGDEDIDDTFVYTEEFSDFTSAERLQISDTDGGTDTVNASAVRSNTLIDLNRGARNFIDGQEVYITNDADIENAYSGDGDDHLSGNALSNTLSGGRGADILNGGSGDDLLDGGTGNDTAVFSGDHTAYKVNYYEDGSYYVIGEKDWDEVNNIEWLQFDDGIFNIHDLALDNIDIPEITLTKKAERFVEGKAPGGDVSSTHPQIVYTDNGGYYELSMIRPDPTVSIYDLYGQFYDTLGTSVGSSIKLASNIYETPVATKLAGGQIAVTWETRGPSAGNTMGHVSILNPDGTFVANDISIFDEMVAAQPTSSSYYWYSPEILALEDGSFLVSGKTGSSSITTTRYSADGTHLGPILSHGVEVNNGHYELINLSNGEVALVASRILDGSKGHMASFSILDASGSEVLKSGSIQFPNATDGTITDYGSINMVALNNGNYALTWVEREILPGPVFNYIYTGQIFDTQGYPSGDSFTYSDIPNKLYNNDLVSLQDGGFLWTRTDGIETTIHRYGVDGLETGEEYKIEGHLSEVTDMGNNIFSIIPTEGNVRHYYQVTDLGVTQIEGGLDVIGLSTNASDTLYSASIALVDVYVAGQMELKLNLPEDSPLNAIFDAKNGVLTISGEASLSDYEWAFQNVNVHALDGSSTLLRLAVNDGNSDSKPFYFSKDISNAAPTVEYTDIIKNEDNLIEGILSAHDFEGDALTFTLLQDTDAGDLILNQDGTFTFNTKGEFENLAEGEVLTQTFTYQVSDGAHSTVASQELTIVGENDASVLSISDNASLTHSSEVQVNTNTRGAQSAPQIATLNNGQLVTLWQGSSTSSIYTRLFDSDGNAVTDEIKTSPNIGRTAIVAPKIIAFEDGTFSVIWLDSTALQFQKFNADGTSQSGTMAYMGVTNNPENYDVVSYGADPSGVFFTSVRADGSLTFRSGGNYTNVYGDGIFVHPDLINLNDSTLYASVNDYANNSYQLKIYSAKGVLVDTLHTQTSEIASDLVAINQGGFAVSWADAAGGIYLNIYTADAGLVSSNIQISAATFEAGSDLQMVALNDGTIVVAWQDNMGLKAQVIDGNGHLIGAEIAINNGALDGSNLVITANADGGFTAVWEENGEISLQSFKSTATSPQYMEGDAPYVLFDGIAISDVDSPTLNGATVTISAGFAAGEDLLSVVINPALGISSSFDNASGVLTLSGTADIADYQSVLASITYENTVSSATSGTRSFTLQVDDGASLNALSNEVSLNLEVMTTNNSGGGDTGTPPTSGSIDGTEAADTLTGTADGDIINGLGGTDVINGGVGNDTISGGAGNDTLSGDAGDDTYLFNRGDDADIINNEGEAGSNDRVLFGASISYDQLWFVQDRQDLQVSVIGTSDSMTFKDWYAEINSGAIASFETDTGTTLDAGKVDSLVSAMAAFNPPAFGETDLSTALQDNLMATIHAAWENE